MFKSVLIANRGAIACRMIKTLKKLGIRAIAVYTEADADSLHVTQADAAISLGDGPVTETYLSIANIIAVAKNAGAEAIHPGYGFLSESAAFAEACDKQGITFIGPQPSHIRAFGLKHTARSLALAVKIPILEGTELLPDLSTALMAASRIGYPVMLKSTAGGGGIGMRVCATDQELRDSYDAVRRLAENAFHCGDVYLEKYIRVARHIEVQIFGDGRGTVVSLGERDCSVQRRQQKVLEETPAPDLADELRQELMTTAIRLTASVGYASAGTVEFLVDADTKDFYFLEVNTRLQVEHGVTEEVSGIDLIEWMLKQAAGELDLSKFVYKPEGVSIQARLYAEDPQHSFRPSAGQLTEATFPKEVGGSCRIETWVERGTEVSSLYDAMLAKIIVKAPSRPEAVAKLAAALEATRIAGIESNRDYLCQIINSESFAKGAVSTTWLGSFAYQPKTIDVLEPGTQSSIQDYPGRVGYWAIGIPPSGPMDDYGFRMANELVGNPASAAALEMTLRGPTLRFNMATTIALTGAQMNADLDGVEVPFWESVNVSAGSVLTLRSLVGSGCRTYLAVGHGGFDVPAYLGSKSTFSLGKFGGHGGRTLRHGDVLHLFAPQDQLPSRRVPDSLRPALTNHWNIMVLYGPHGAPDFFTEEFINTFLMTLWTVHYNSNRLGIRLMGPKPQFSRPDGGEAGLHPSNIHDNEYAIGTINFTGDLPVILAKDGPSLGGFVCPVTIIKADLWKIGQLRPGDQIRFVRCTYEEALVAEQRQDVAIKSVGEDSLPHNSLSHSSVAIDSFPLIAEPSSVSAILEAVAPSPTCPGVVYRQAGDRYILIEYGPAILDLDLRFRVHALMAWFACHPLPGIIELSPGVRSLQVYFDPKTLSRKTLLNTLMAAEKELPAAEDLEFPTRILKLPLAFDATTTREAIAKYQQSVRREAPWLPQNTEFIRRINGLDSIDAVEEKIFDARYLVLGLGDVYLGAPCAVPLDPRHRLVTTKYNPARTWTAEGEVGIGGVYMCIYGMESPGGYQLVGRTVPVWNTHRVTRETQPGQPWLLRFFDQVQFFPMAEKDLLDFRREFVRGRVSLDIQHETFRVRDYHSFLQHEAESIATFKARQQIAFESERDRWAEAGSVEIESSPEKFSLDTTITEPQDQLEGDTGRMIGASIAGSIWSINVKPGDFVQAGQCVAVIEAMKMEVAVEAESAGVVKSINVAKGKVVNAGHPLMTIEGI